MSHKHTHSHTHTHRYVSLKNEGDKMIVAEKGDLLFVFNFHPTNRRARTHTHRQTQTRTRAHTHTHTHAHQQAHARAGTHGQTQTRTRSAPRPPPQTRAPLRPTAQQPVDYTYIYKFIILHIYNNSYSSYRIGTAWAGKYKIVLDSDWPEFGGAFTYIYMRGGSLHGVRGLDEWGGGGPPVCVCVHPYK